MLLWSSIGTLLYAVSGVCVLKCRTDRVKFFEKLTRNPLIGLLLGWFALAVCVPHAAAVAPAFMHKMLYPLAVAIPLLGFKYVDYAAARAVSGTVILCAYNLVHLTFDAALPAAPFFAVCGWISGAFGIWCSGLPWAWRDIFRKCSCNDNLRYCTAGALFFFSLVFALSAGVFFL